MIIIVDGPDGSGKSTLTRKLYEQTGWKVVHMVRPKTIEEKMFMVEKYLELMDRYENLILDRSWYSEMVYGPIMREGSRISDLDMIILEKHARLKGALIIYCTDDVALLWHRAQSRGEDYIPDKETLRDIKEGFDHLFLRSNVNHLIPVVTFKVSQS